MNEIWRDIPGHEGKYQASSYGRVRSLTRQITQIGRGGKPFTRTVKGRILRPGPTKSGHLYVVLGKGAAGSPVHQLILHTFKGSPPKDEEVRHINGDPTDNRLENLIYGTRTDNILDVYKIGKRWRKLSIEQVKEIRKALAKGVSGAELARCYDVSQQTISNIKRGVIFWWLA